MKKKLLALILALAMVLSLTACGDQSADPSDNSDDSQNQEASDTLSQKVYVSTAQGGSLYYTVGIAITQLWTEKIPGAVASANSSSGSAENLNLLISGETNLGIVQSNLIKDAYSGENAFAGDPHEEMRIIAPLTTAYYHIIARKNADIHCLADARGKRVCVGLSGSGNMTTNTLIFDAIGMSFDDFDPQYVSMSEALEAMKNGLMDMTIVFGQYPDSNVMDAVSAAGSNLELVSFTQDEIDKITAANSWIVKATIPGGTYTGYDEDILTLAHNGFLCATADFPENDAYLLTKTTFSNLDWLREAYAGLDCYATQNLAMLGGSMQFYVDGTRYVDVWCFRFKNVYDMPETLTATGELKLTGNNESDAAAMYGVQRKFGVKVTDEYTVNSGSIMLQSDYKLWHNMLNAQEVEILVDGEWLPIVITKQKFERSFRRSVLKAVEFSFTMANPEQNNLIGRINFLFYDGGGQCGEPGG